MEEAFVAVAVNVYAVLSARPVTSHDPEGPGAVHVIGGVVAGVGVTVKDAGTPPRVPSVAVPAVTVTVTLESPTTTVGLAGIPGGDRRVTGVDGIDTTAVLVFLVRTFFLTAATLNAYVPSARPVTVHAFVVDDCVSLFAHPVVAPVHGPLWSTNIDVTCTTYPITFSVGSSSTCLSHDTTTWPALGDDADTSPGVVAQSLPNVSPRTMTEGASVASPPVTLPSHAVRSITPHAMTAPAAFPLLDPEPNAPKRRMRALIVGRASPGLCPIIVHVFVTIGDGGSAHYRVNTVIFRRFCPVCGDLSDYTTLGRPLRDDQRRARALMHGVT